MTIRYGASPSTLPPLFKHRAQVIDDLIFWDVLAKVCPGRHCLTSAPHRHSLPAIHKMRGVR